MKLDLATLRDRHLVESQINEKWLKRRSIELFCRAQLSGRLIALVGSYAVQDRYGSWDELITNYLVALQDDKSAYPSDSIRAELKSKFAKSGPISDLQQLLIDQNTQPSAYDPPTRIDLAEIAAELDPDASPEAHRSFRQEFFSKHFSLEAQGSGSSSAPLDSSEVVSQLLNSLKIRRFMTLNYDLEIEWALMTHGHERAAAKQLKSRQKVWAKLIEDRVIQRATGGQLQRHVDGLGLVTSDIVQRGKGNSITEFTLRDPNSAAQILHLHGRFDEPASLVLSRRDYRDRYWKDDKSFLSYTSSQDSLFQGNPVLFVGLGMNEPEPNRTFEQLLSNNPNRRPVPSFLLWEGDGKSGADRLFRMSMYRRFGTHLLFEQEVLELAGLPLPSSTSLSDQERLKNQIEALGVICDQYRQRHFWRDEDAGESGTYLFRNAQSKLDSAKPSGRDQSARVDLWKIESQGKDFADGAVATISNPEAVVRRMQRGATIKLISGSPGTARGSFARALAAEFEMEHETGAPGVLLTINGSFATEGDSIFSVLSGIFDFETAEKGLKSRYSAVQDLPDRLGALAKASLEGKKTPFERCTIIFNSFERFIAEDGSSLSAELDNLIRLIGKDQEMQRDWADLTSLDTMPRPFPINIIVIGSARVRRYLTKIGAECDYLRLVRSPTANSKSAASDKGAAFELMEDAEHQPPLSYSPDDDERTETFQVTTKFSNYPKRLEAALNEAAGEDVVRFEEKIIDRVVRRHRFFAQVLETKTLAAVGFENQILVLEILRTLAFIGQPSEPEVLLHNPFVVEQLKKGSRSKRNSPRLTPSQTEKLAACLEKMLELGLLIPVQNFVDQSDRKEDAWRRSKLVDRRLGLHKMLLSELRERHGVPFSDSRLLASFNLSLCSTHSFDSYVPSHTWHDDLSTIADWLVGAHFDEIEWPSPPGGRWAMVSRDGFWDALRKDERHVRELSNKELIAMGSPEMVSCLRAAVSLLRSYYTVPSLLMRRSRNLDPFLRDGPLTEYAERLERLVRVFRSVQKVRQYIQANLTGKHKRWYSELKGPDSLYADDLLWLLNELGVVRTNQGELYDARIAFGQAELINSRFVEFNDRHQNWRRIQLNQLQVDIERGKIGGALNRIRAIEDAIETYGDNLPYARQYAHGEKSDYPKWAPAERVFDSIKDEIVYRYVHDPATKTNGKVDRSFPNDLVLSVALVLGYQAICCHLRGALVPAKAHFEDALEILHRIEEVRAYATFQRHYAALLSAMGHDDEAIRALDICVASGGPGKHPDIEFSGRIARAYYSPGASINSPKSPPVPIHQLQESFEYAQKSDMRRLELEAVTALAIAQFKHGDYDTSLQYAYEAISIASRCGFGLRKVSLRILLGRIVAARGDRKRARQILEQAQLLGTRMSYESAVQTAGSVLIENT